MLSQATFESPKHWDLGRIVRRKPSSANSSEGYSPFSLKRFAKRSRTSSTSTDGDGPPLPPPKDGPKRSSSPKRSTSTMVSNGSRSMSNGDQNPLGTLNLTFNLNSQITTPPSPPDSAPLPPPKARKSVPLHPPRKPPAKLPTPAERAKARIEAEKQRELEIRLAEEEDKERRARMKAEKEEERRREEEEEARRKQKTEQDVRIAQLLRQERDHRQAKAEEEFAQKIEERRQQNKAKRLQVTSRCQAWRTERERSKERTLHEKEVEKQRREKEKHEQLKKRFEEMETKHPNGPLIFGCITVHAGDRTAGWKRRKFTVDRHTLKFFKDQPDPIMLVDVIALSDIRTVRDCGDPSEEEPTFTPNLNSFMIEETSGCCWSLFTDTAEEKVGVMAALIFSSEVHRKLDPVSRIPRLTKHHSP